MLLALERITTLTAAMQNLQTNIFDTLKHWALYTLRDRLCRYLRPGARPDFNSNIREFVNNLNAIRNEDHLPFSHVYILLDTPEYVEGAEVLIPDDVLRPLQAYIGSGAPARAVTRHEMVVQQGRRTRRSAGNPVQFASFEDDSIAAWGGEQAGHPAFVLGIIKSPNEWSMFCLLVLRDERVRTLWSKLWWDLVSPGVLGQYNDRNLETLWDSFRLLASALTSPITQGFQTTIRFDGRPELYTLGHGWAYWDQLVAVFGCVPHEFTEEQRGVVFDAVLGAFEDFFIFDASDDDDTDEANNQRPIPMRAWRFPDSTKLFWSIRFAITGPGFIIATSETDGTVSELVDADYTPWFTDGDGHPFQPP